MRLTSRCAARIVTRLGFGVPFRRSRRSPFRAGSVNINLTVRARSRRRSGRDSWTALIRLAASSALLSSLLVPCIASHIALPCLARNLQHAPMPMTLTSVSLFLRQPETGKSETLNSIRLELKIWALRRLMLLLLLTRTQACSASARAPHCLHYPLGLVSTRNAQNWNVECETLHGKLNKQTSHCSRSTVVLRLTPINVYLANSRSGLHY